MAGELVPKGRRRRSPSELAAEESECLRLKILGLRDEEIGYQVGLTRQTVSKRIRAAVDKHGKTSVETWREICAQRYEVAIQALGPAMRESDLQAIALWLSATEKFQKLVGATAPERAEITVTHVGEQERALADMLAQAERDQKMKEADLTAETT